MTNSSGSSQCDPEIAILSPEIFWGMETNPSSKLLCSFTYHAYSKNSLHSKLGKSLYMPYSFKSD